VSVFPFTEGFNVMADFGPAEESQRIYVNVATPPIVADQSITWTDLYLDVIFVPDRPPRICDLDELELAVRSGLVAPHVAERAVGRAKEIAASSAPLFRPVGLREYVELVSGGTVVP
jgi:predicted RNA-binding protein associated with RNAse of E/G family